MLAWTIEGSATKRSPFYFISIQFIYLNNVRFAGEQFNSPLMFFRLTTADSPPQPSRPVPSIHSSDNKSGITFAKICLRLKRHGSTESAEARDDDRRSQSSLPPLNGSPSPTLPTPPPSPQQARASSENITSPSSPRSPVISPSSSSRSSTSRSPKQKHHHAESSSGQIPLTHPGIAEHACPRREPIDRLDTYYCTGGVNVPVLLRTTRTDMIDIASILGANALVEEQCVSPLKLRVSFDSFADS